MGKKTKKGRYILRKSDQETKRPRTEETERERKGKSKRGEIIEELTEGKRLRVEREGERNRKRLKIS